MYRSSDKTRDFIIEYYSIFDPHLKNLYHIPPITDHLKRKRTRYLKTSLTHPSACCLQISVTTKL